jgi:hypothetical protein
LGAGLGAAGAGAAALPPKILNITTPHVGHLPLMALRPFFIVSSTASAISFLALHLTQYPSGIKLVWADASGVRHGLYSLRAAYRKRQLVKRIIAQLVFFQQHKSTLIGHNPVKSASFPLLHTVLAGGIFGLHLPQVGF